MYPNFVEEKKLWKKGFKRVAGLDEAGRGCEKPDAEVLTNNGWKTYNRITLGDKVLSYANDGYIIWQKIERIIEKKFKGNLIELKNRGICIVITPDHYFTVIRRVFSRDKKDNNKLKLVGYKTREERKMVTELLANDVIPRGGKWKGLNKNFFRLPAMGKSKGKLISIRLWVAFMGIFLSEGSTSYDGKSGSYKIVISQSENSSRDKYKRIYHLLQGFPFKFNKFKEGFTCYNKQLYVYLKQFGNCYNKFIPKELKELPPELLAIFIDWMILGDGACYIGKDRKKVCVYYTVSEILRDDFEEVLLKAGWTFHTSVRTLRDRYIKRRLIKKENQVPCFEIRLRRNNKVQVKSLHKREVSYMGKVFCLQLPMHHNFFIRRNGTGYFTGNSLGGPVTAGAVFVKPSFTLTPDLIGVKDSKQLSPKKREEFYKIITKHPEIEWGIGVVSEKVIDKINIKNAAELAMAQAVKNLKPKPDFLIIDGNSLKNKTLKKMNHQLMVKADEKVFSCAAASIVAKVTRDRMMLKYHQKYPQYGFDKHKGYPTQFHRAMLNKYGRCAIHRNSFHYHHDSTQTTSY